ncbi:MAG TPA: efflux RND transporter periplasmic adaptor subunit [Candidatus Handelsmanbacteria bacterium]|nr:efflux RND transporter periplasmic adaptor subunit [Candidatus Handelsmanbacteria bacterium]
MIRRSMAATLLVLCSCSEEGPRIDVESSIPVRVESVARHPIAEYVTATGTVEARQEAQLKSLQQGFYQLQTNPRTGASYVMGDEVEAGALLVLLVNPELVNQVSMESKQLAFTSAQREFEKQQGLLEKGGITLRELAAAERAYIDARYALENATIQLAKLEARIPFSGLLVDLPHYRANQLLDAGASLAVIMDYDELYAEVSLPGNEIDRIAPGQQALVTHYGDAGTDTLQGRIDQVSPVLDRESRMFKAVLMIDNDSLAIRPGMFVKIDIVVAAKDSALVIPKEVILDRGDSKAVFVVEKGIALERHLETGLSNREQIEVLSGLELEDRLVVEGFETLRNQSKVKLASNQTTDASR